MRKIHAIAFAASAALFLAGCETHEDHREPASVAYGSTDVAVDEPQGEVVSGPGVEAIDVDPDPAQRTYIYDEGYPPGTYTYNGYYYYGGYRYPRDIFVNRYVQENIRQHRFADKEQNHRQAQVIEQRHRTEFTKTHGVRQQRSTPPAAERRDEPARQPEAPRPNGERPEIKTPAHEEPKPNVERPEGREPAREAPKPNVERPEVREPAREAPKPNVEHPENRPGTNEEHRPAGEPKVNPAEEHKPGAEEPKREEGK